MIHDGDKNPAVDSLPDDQRHHCENHPAKDMAENPSGDHIEKPPSGDQPRKRRRKQSPYFLPIHVMTEARNGHEVGDDQ